MLAVENGQEKGDLGEESGMGSCCSRQHTEVSSADPKASWEGTHCGGLGSRLHPDTPPSPSGNLNWAFGVIGLGAPSSVLPHHLPSHCVTGS